MLHDTEIIELGPECRERYFCGDVYPLLDTLGVPVAGYSELQGHYRVQRCGAEHLLAVSLYGCGEGGPADSPWRMEAGSLLLVPAGQAYVQRTLGGARWHSAWALLQPAQWPNFPAHAQVLRAEGGADLAPLMDLLHQERFRCDPAATELRRSLCESLVAVLQRLLRGSRPEGAAHAGLQSLFAAVAAEPAQAWSLEQLSGRLGCSRSQLHRLCVAQYGRSPAAQVQALRLQQARYWLRSTRLPLKVIAERLGFANAYHFSAAFKREQGCAPNAFRKG